MMELALLNVKNSFKNYLSLVLSLAFTILVLFNFQNVIDSGSFEVLGTRNREYVEMIIQVISFVLGCFMFFFIWYSTNVFLTRRKREIGIYVFMGLSNERIGKLYFLEAALIGLSALVLGLTFGVLGAGLFQMILLAVSELSVEVQFRSGFRPILITTGVYLSIYLIFVVKGYLSITKSSVLNMISAVKQNEYVRQKKAVLVVKTVLGVGILCTGYYLAVKKSHSGAMKNAFAAVVLVTTGVYLLFGGLLPLLFQVLSSNKRFLYQKQRVLWINNVIFRMKKNYRTYAMVCILMLCSVTALATGFAMRERYNNIIQFENTYTFQILSSHKDLDKKAREAIETNNEIVFSSRISIVSLPSSQINSGRYNSQYAILSFSELKRLAQETGLEFEVEKLAEDEVIAVSHLPLMSLITEQTGIKVEISGKTYTQTKDIHTPYLGYLQEAVSFYVVSDSEYERLLPMGKAVYAYNYRIGNPKLFSQTKDILDQMIAGLGEKGIGRVAIDPENHELDWVKVMYSICIFMFLVFILASGSILFMKLYNDAFEEKGRCLVIMNMGFDRGILKRSIKAELGMAYGIPFAVMGISSCFSVGALAKMMYTDLTMINAASVAVVFLILVLWYLLSVRAYERNAGVNQQETPV